MLSNINNLDHNDLYKLVLLLNKFNNQEHINFNKIEARFFEIQDNIENNITLTIEYIKAFGSSPFEFNIFWSFVEDFINQNYDKFTVYNKINLLLGFSYAKRGDNSFWGLVLDDINNDKHLLTYELMIDLITAVTNSTYYNYDISYYTNIVFDLKIDQLSNYQLIKIIKSYKFNKTSNFKPKDIIKIELEVKKRWPQLPNRVKENIFTIYTKGCNPLSEDATVESFELYEILENYQNSIMN